MIFHGYYADVPAVAASRAIHERIKGSELVIIPSAAHLSNMEQPGVFTAALTRFLAKHSK